MSAHRKDQIDKLQKCLPLIREVMGWSVSDLADKLDVTSQTILNLEKKQTAMTFAQYIAIRVLVDYEIGKEKNLEKGNLIANLIEEPELQTKMKGTDIAKLLGSVGVVMGFLPGIGLALTTAVGATFGVLLKKYLTDLPEMKPTYWQKAIFEGGDSVEPSDNKGMRE